MTACYGKHVDIDEFKDESAWSYQTIIINGKIAYESDNWSGGKEVIFKRYAGFRCVLDRYKRPFKILDIGANSGFFGIKVAEDYESVVVMVDRNERLKKICARNTDRHNIIYLKRSLSLDDIKKLIQTEHFDVILAFHVLHHQADWKEWIDALFDLGDNVIIETPPVNDHVNKNKRTKEIAKYVTSLPRGVRLGSFSRGKKHGKKNTEVFDHMIWFCQNPQGFETEPSRLGILPSTFLSLGGAFPDPNQVSRLDEIDELVGTVSFVYPR